LTDSTEKDNIKESKTDKKKEKENADKKNKDEIRKALTKV